MNVFYTGVSAGYSPLWVAKEAGIFERNGLDVNLQPSEGGPIAMAALLSGQGQAAQVSAPTLLGPVADGADLEVVAIMIPVHNFVLEVMPNIKTAQDLKGQKLAVVSPGGADDVALRVALRKLGVDPKDVSISGVGSVQNEAAAMLNGAIVGAMLTPPQTLTVEDKGAHVLLDLAAQKLPNAGQSVIVQRSYANSQRKAVQAYVDSLIQAVARMKKDKPYTLDVFKKYLKLDDERALSATYDFYVGEVFPSLPYPNTDMWNDAMAVAVQSNDKLQGFDISKVVDSSFVKSADDRGLAK